MYTRPVLGTVILVMLSASAHASSQSDYDDLLAKAHAAALKERWVECMRLYNHAMQAFPSDSSRPSAEWKELRDNRERCRQQKPASVPPPQVALGKLSMNTPALIGRKAELKQLDEAWDGHPRRHVVAVVALGGQGKTTLITNWLLRMQGTGFRGARRIFAWSFYHQGISDSNATSADEFLTVALRFFGDPRPDIGTSFQKADRLRDLVRKERSLLILDGLDPLQSSPTSPENEGVLRDLALAALLKDLAANNPGLVIVTSRAKLADLSAFEGRALQTISLKPFSEVDGVSLLRSIGVRGAEQELADAVRESHGHPLTLALLGSLLCDAYNGDIRRRFEVGPLKKGDARGVHAQHVMDAYDRWLGGGPERAILRLLGLFDRPAPGAALKVLRAAPAVRDLNESLVGLSDAAWKQIVARLRRAGLVEQENAMIPDSVDTHLLVREHFGDILKKENEAAWKEGHRRLYAWYATLSKDQPDSAEEMAPLYAAVWHGCRAGRYQEAFDNVFWPRIRRYGTYYSINKRGSYPADLSALSSFFLTHWTRLVPNLQDQTRRIALREAGSALRAVGRLEEALEPTRVSLDLDRARNDWQSEAINITNLSELQLALGQVTEAIVSAKRLVDLADGSGVAYERMARRAVLANAMHQAGHEEQALELFLDAEGTQAQRQPNFRILSGLQGYQYCDLLLARGKAGEVRHRAELSLGLAKQSIGGLLSVGLDHLSLGRAYAARLATGRRIEATRARDQLNQAVTSLRESGRQDYLPLGLIYRAAFFRQFHDYPSAAHDLDEALLIATRGHMCLHETDARLERTRLLLAKNDIQAARYELTLAQKLIQATGYARRVPEAVLLAQQLGVR
jgi:tetratricopeptide (TPR) repeat protein